MEFDAKAPEFESFSQHFDSTKRSIPSAALLLLAHRAPRSRRIFWPSWIEYIENSRCQSWKRTTQRSQRRPRMVTSLSLSMHALAQIPSMPTCKQPKRRRGACLVAGFVCDSLLPNTEFGAPCKVLFHGYELPPWFSYERARSCRQDVQVRAWVHL